MLSLWLVLAIGRYRFVVLLEELPKVTDWMQGWGSLAGVVVSAGALIFTGLLLRHEMRAAREAKKDAEAERSYLAAERRDAEKRQARLVTVETTWVGQSDKWYAGFRVANDSHAPIHDLTVRLVVGLDTLPDLPRKTELDPKATIKFTADFQRLLAGEIQEGDLLAPHVFPVSRGDEYQQSRQVVAGLYATELTFTDAEGRRWRRWGSRQPQQILGDEGERLI